MAKKADAVKGERNTRNTVVLTKRGEEILHAIYFYRYMTALDVCQLLYSPSSLTYVRNMLTKLAGGGDDVNNQYLYRFALPNVGAGNTERVYTLGGLGRDYLVRETGLEVEWYFRPHKVKHMSYSSILHNLLLTRFLVAAKRWASLSHGFELVNVRTCYELGRVTEDEKAQEGKTEKGISVIPDAWLMFRRRGQGKGNLPVLLEIDRGTAYRIDFKRHVRGRVEYIGENGDYRRLFGTQAVTVAYLTTGGSGEHMETRRRTMCVWTMEVLRELGCDSWASVFRFCAVGLQDIYEKHMFEERVWYRPDEKKAVGLFGG